VRKLMWFTFGFGAACVFSAYFYMPWLLTAGSIAFALAGIMLIVMRFYRPLRIGVAVFLGVAIGFGWYAAYDGVYLSDARASDGKILHVTVVATDYSYVTTYGCAFDGETEIGGKRYALRAYLDMDEEISPGDSVTGEFSFRLTTNGGAEEPTYHQGKGIFLIAYQKGKEVEFTEAESVSWRLYPAIWRKQLIDMIDSILPSDTAGFAKALLLGVRTDIDYVTNTAFKVSGISHIIAVSGLHVSILCGLVYVLTARRRIMTALIGIPCVLVFLAIAGFSPSVVRAGIMQVLIMLALLFNQEYDPWTALSFSAFVLLAINPLVITSVSFQLSFGCMVGVFLFSEKIKAWLIDIRLMKRLPAKIAGFVSSSVAITVSATVFTTPLVAVYFGTVSLVGVVTNLLVLWVVSYVFYGTMLLCVVGCFSHAAAGMLGWVIAWPIRYILFVAKALSRLPLAAVYTESIYTVVWLIFCYLLLGSFLCLKKRSPGVFCSAAVLGLCLALVCSWSEPYLCECRVTVLDVGQGQAVLLQSEGKTFLVDCGGEYADDVADKVAETLLSQGISCLDGIVVSHFDADHVNGLEFLLTRIDTKQLLLPFVEDTDGTGKLLEAMCPDTTVWVKGDLVLSFEETNLTVFAPISYISDNESSMCVLFKTENCAILITGDRGMLTERMLVERYEIGKLDVLVVGHHGARTSTSEELLAATQPKYAIISVGQDNSYGHPAHSVLERLRKYNCKILRTDLYGTILFRR